MNRSRRSLASSHTEKLLSSPQKLFNRYQTDFVEIELIGKGGFGQVVKARNKLDDRTYAIKKVKLNDRDREAIIEEVKTLARMVHKNVVRYYYSWIEGETVEANSASSVDDDWDSDSVSEKSNLGQQYRSATGAQKKSFDADPFFDESWSSGSDCSSASTTAGVDIECESCGKRYKDWLVEDQFWEKIPINLLPLDLCEKCFKFQLRETGYDVSDIKIIYPEPARTPPQHLYIQMDYCTETLRNTIDDGKLIGTNNSWRIFGQIVEGLAYIHSQGIVHRDMKPGNIFIDEEQNVKIGDFGLATTIVPYMGAHDSNYSHFDSVVGTTTYSSPEGGRGEKSDIYSLGIILFEMNYRCNTRMERAKVLRNLRNGTFPADFEGPTYDQVRVVIRELLQKRPEKRPSAMQILSGKFLPADSFPNFFGIAKTLDLIENPNSIAFVQLMNSLFDHKRDRKMERNCAIFDDSYALRSTNPLLLSQYDSDLPHAFDYIYAHNSVSRKIKKVFKSHGAIKVEVPMVNPSLVRVWNVNTNSDKADLLTNSGRILTLPYDLRSGFAKFLAKLRATGYLHTIPNHLKRYSIGSIYRSDNGHGFPEELRVADFDIIIHKSRAKAPPHEEREDWNSFRVPICSPVQKRRSALDDDTFLHTYHTTGDTPPMRDPCFTSSMPDSSISTKYLESSDIEVIVAEAEIIRIATELFDKFDFIPQYFIQINHMHLNKAIFDVVGIFEPQTRTSINEIISSLTRDPWSVVSLRLANELSLSADVIERLTKSFQLKGSPKHVLTALSTIFCCTNFSNQAHYYAAQSTIHYLDRLLKALEQMLVPLHRIAFDCSLVSTDKFASGLWFHVTGRIGERKQLSCLGVGGRYDSLINHFTNEIKSTMSRPITQESPDHTNRSTPDSFSFQEDIIKPETNGEVDQLCAVGITIAVDKVIDFYKKQVKNQEPTIAIPEASVLVYVCSTSSLFAERIGVVSQLWGAGIKADFVRDKSLSLEKQQEYANTRARYIIVLEDMFQFHSTLHVHDNVARKKSNMHISQLISHILQESNPAPSSNMMDKSTARGCSLPTELSAKKPNQLRTSFLNRLGIPPPAPQ